MEKAADKDKKDTFCCRMYLYIMTRHMQNVPLYHELVLLQKGLRFNIKELYRYLFCLAMIIHMSSSMVRLNAHFQKGHDALLAVTQRYTISASRFSREKKLGKTMPIKS